MKKDIRKLFKRAKPATRVTPGTGEEARPANKRGQSEARGRSHPPSKRLLLVGAGAVLVGLLALAAVRMATPTHPPTSAQVVPPPPPGPMIPAAADTYQSAATNPGAENSVVVPPADRDEERAPVPLPDAPAEDRNDRATLPDPFGLPPSKLKKARPLAAPAGDLPALPPPPAGLKPPDPFAGIRCVAVILGPRPSAVLEKNGVQIVLSLGETSRLVGTLVAVNAHGCEVLRDKMRKTITMMEEPR